MGNFLNCASYPVGQDYQEPVISGIFQGPMPCTPPPLPPCANNLQELYCLIEAAETAECKVVQVCDGSVIDFDPFFFNFQLEVPDGVTIECAGCDCELKRRFSPLLFSLCPFFTAQLGSKVNIKGFKYSSRFQAIVGPPGPSFDAQANIISFNDYDMVTGGLLQNPVTIKGMTEITQTVCPAPSSTKKSAKSGCPAPSAKSAKSAKSTKGKRFLQNGSGEPVTFFCGDPFFGADEGSVGGSSSTTSDNNARVQERTPLLDLFERCDTNNDQYVSCDEAKNCLVEGGFSGIDLGDCSDLFAQFPGSDPTVAKSGNGIPISAISL